MDFEELVVLYEELEKTASGNKMREILSEFFKKAPKDDIGVISYLTLVQIASEYEGLVLGIAEKSVLKAIAKAAGIDEDKTRKVMQETGDAGLTAEKLLQKKPKTLVPLGKLTVKEFFEKLHKIASSSGTGSQDTKINIIVGLLQKSSPTGAKYIVRIALSSLRMGVGDMTVLDSLSIAYTGSKENKEILEKAYNICPDVGIIAETLAKKGMKEIEKIDVHIGRPIKMMLAQRISSLEEVQEKISGKLAIEAKYDGERMQLHKTYAERTEQLAKIVIKGKHITLADRIITDNLEEVDKFFHKMLKAGQEGIMIKGMDTEYQAGTRGWNWIKWKKEYAKDMTDTVDLVIIGAMHGKGKRSGTYGALLCASYNEEEDIFESVTKLGTGLTDEMLSELPKKLKKYQVDKQPARVKISQVKPDVWFEPKIVVEVLAAEVTISPSHAAGVALRFPRFIRIREDKKAEQATTTKEIKR